jgi:molecular chaperone GrpE (heat shock protein)
MQGDEAMSQDDMQKAAEGHDEGESTPAGVAEEAGAQARPVDHGQQEAAEVVERLRNLEAQSNFLLQQVAYLLQAVNQHSAALQDNQVELKQELKRFQTGGPQRAMAAVFYKLFRDLLNVMNQLDDLVALGLDGERTEEEKPWIRSLKMLHRQFEFILTEWGCRPVDIQLFVTEFDPELHEAIPAEEGIPSLDPDGKPIPEDTIVKVEQRGWMLQDTVLQYPRVVVR